MMKIILRPSATLAFCWLVLFMGVNSVDISAVEFLPESTVVTTPHPKTKFNMNLRITNRIYYDSLNDPESEEYKSLKQEVEQLFFEVYSPTPLEYLGTDQMTFRNGSVIVSAQLLFGTTIFDPVGRSLFILRYKQLPSPTLEIDLDYVASVNSVDMFAVETSTETTAVPTLSPQSKFYMEIRITNRIYNTTLEDEKSEDYTLLSGEVKQLFSEVYNNTPLEYISTDQITFRKGSVIAGAELLFGTIMIYPVLERGLFLQRYVNLTSPALAIDLKFVANELPTQIPVDPPTSTFPPTSTTPLTSHMTTHTTLNTSHRTSTHSTTHTTTLTSSTVQSTTHTLHSTTSLSPTITPHNTTMHPNNNTTQSPTTHNNINTTTSHNSINTTTLHNRINTTTPHNGTNTTTPQTSINTTTPHNGTNTTTPQTSINTTTPHNGTNTTTPQTSINTTTPHNGTNTTTPHNGTNTTTPQTSINTTTPHNGTNTTTTTHGTNTTMPPNATIPLPIHNITHITSTITSRPTDSPTTAGALVPGWGIALLVLAAISLLLLIILLIILLVMCCCWPNKRTVVKEPEVITPPMYFNPDIPMYSTHSTVDSPNGKQVDVIDKPPKNRTGMYVVNK